MDKYRIEISRLLKPLSFQKRLIFGVLTCEKLYPNYVYFSRNTSWGDEAVLQNAISIIYQNVFRNDLFSGVEIQNLIDEVEGITPDTENFEGILVSFALDACTSVLSTLNFIIDSETENIVDVATFARDTVDMYTQERDNLDMSDKMIEIKIEQDIFMQKEKQRQYNVIKLLSEKNEITDSQLQNLREIQPQLIVDISLLPEKFY
jgi:uncharacterized protein YjaG (DUF416 family)